MIDPPLNYSMHVVPRFKRGKWYVILVDWIKSDYFTVICQFAWIQTVHKFIHLESFLLVTIFNFSLKNKVFPFSIAIAEHEHDFQKDKKFARYGNQYISVWNEWLLPISTFHKIPTPILLQSSKRKQKKQHCSM